jgi:protein O-mannosyl-transferase
VLAREQPDGAAGGAHPDGGRTVQRWPSLTIIILLLVVLAATALIYAPALQGEFQFDDVQSVQRNQKIRSLARFFQPGIVVDVLHGRRVLTELTFALNYAWGGNTTPAFHATNLAIHLATVLCVFFFTRHLGRRVGLARVDGVALVVASLFALHPMQTQAVAYLVQRSESLASLLYLGALLLLLDSERAGRALRGRLAYAGAFLLFVLGLAAKIIVITVPLGYVLIGFLPSGGPHPRSLRARMVRIAPFLLYGLVVAVLMIGGLEGEDSGFHVPALPPWRYLLTQCRVVVTYLRLLLLPIGQSVDWDFPFAGWPPDLPRLLLGLALSALLVAALATLLRRGRAVGSTRLAVAFGLLWFFIVLLPTSSFLPLADVFMEHRTYLASWGIFFAGVASADWALSRLAHERGARIGQAIALVLCIAFATATHFRAQLWSSKLLLWGDAVAKAPQKARPHLGLANALYARNDRRAAIEEYQTALRLAARDPRWMRTEIRGKLATTLLTESRPDAAIAVLQTGLGEDPENSDLLGVLALAHLQNRELALAESAASRSVLHARAPAAALRVLGLVRLQSGKAETAIDPLEKAVRLEPKETQGRLLLARGYRALGRDGDACTTLRSVHGPTDDLAAESERELVLCKEAEGRH